VYLFLCRKIRRFLLLTSEIHGFLQAWWRALLAAFRIACTVLQFRDLPDFEGVISSVSVVFLLAVTLQTSCRLALSLSLYGLPCPWCRFVWVFSFIADVPLDQLDSSCYGYRWGSSLRWNWRLWKTCNI